MVSMSLCYLAEYFKVSFPTHTSSSHVGSDMGNGDRLRTCLDHKRPINTRLGHDYVVAFPAPDRETVMFENFDEQ